MLSHVTSASCSTSAHVQRQCKPVAKAFICGSARRVSSLGASCSGRASSLDALSKGPSRRAQSVIVRASDGEPPVEYNKEFGYSRKDITLLGVGLIGLGYALYYGLQATGMEAGYAGNWVQLIMVLGICVGWISTYLFRVATKQMTYVKQLEAYEEAVMQKRIEEMTDEQLAEMVTEAEADKLRGGPARKSQAQGQQPPNI